MENESKLTSGLNPQLSDENKNYFKLETESKSLEQLKLTHKKLSYLCLNFDPFSSEMNTQEVENLINEFNLKELVKDPYKLTNYLLQNLTDLEEAINKKIN